MSGSVPLPCTGLQAVFFSQASSDIAEAKALCACCPMRASCLDQALTVPFAFQDGCGVWGGTTPAERRAIRRAGTARATSA